MAAANRMDLLATCLRIAEAEDKIDIIEKHGIDSFSLKLLNSDDLNVLGITDQSKQEVFLDKIATLDIPSEDIQNTQIDEEYIKLVSYLISSQLQKHLASLSCAVLRKDVVVNDVQLVPALECLEQCLVSLEKESKRFRMLINKPSTNWNKYFMCTIAVGSFLAGSLILIKLTNT